MARRLYYQDSYGRVHRARSAERSRGLPGGLAAKAPDRPGRPRRARPARPLTRRSARPGRVPERALRVRRLERRLVAVAAGALAGPRVRVLAARLLAALRPRPPVRAAFATFAEAFRSDGPTSSTSSS